MTFTAANSTEDLGPIVLAVTVTTSLLALIAVILRFIARRALRAPLWWDDWLILPTPILGFGGIIVASLSTSHGFGRHIFDVGLEAQNYALRIIFATQFIYIWCMFFAKASILALYWRLFKTSFLRYPVIFLFLIDVAWIISTNIAAMLECYPIQDAWNLFLAQASCVKIAKVWLGVAIPNIVTDFIILVLPLPCIWNLNIPRTQKYLCSGIFLLGGFVSILSIIRFLTLFNVDMTSPDVTWNFAPTATWSAVESHLAVVSACLPCLRPIVNYIFTGSFETSRASSPVSSGGPNFSKEDSKTWGAGLFRCKSRGGKGTNYVANDLESLRSEPIGTEPGSRESKAHFGSEICEEVTEKMELERTDHSSIKGLKIYADLVEELRHDLSI